MPRLVRSIWILTGVHLVAGMVAYVHFLVTGSYRLLGWYFTIFGSLFFLIMAAAECSLAFVCRSWFESDEPMRLAWSMIAFAALARLAGTGIRELADGRLNWGPNQWLLPHVGGWFASQSQFGMVIGGPLSMAFLAAGLGRVLSVQRKFRLSGSLTRGDKALLILIVAFSLSQLAINVPLLRQHTSPGTSLLWLSDPLLALLLIEAVLVRRSVLRIGQGLLARCWGSFVVAIVTTSLGDASIWANNRNLLPDSLIALSWYIWFVAAAAFTCAPAYQLEAMSATSSLRQLEVR
ncbi:MAG TPA: hypothetical protein VK716_04965 [Terracidiphilus sp.]|nr:hypothetical protein [Terracidiphilus sp.]